MKGTRKKRVQRGIVLALLMSMTCQGLPMAAQAADAKVSIPASAISAWAAKSHEASLAVDGNPQTYWQSIPSNGGGDDYAKMYDHNRYIDITLDGTYDLSQIKIYNQVNGSYNNYYVYASKDGVNYDKIISKTSNDAAAAAGDSYTVDVEASYLRLDMAYNSNSFVTNLAEIEVYGTKTSGQVTKPAAIQVENWQGSKWQQEWDKFETDADYAKEKVLAEMSSLVGRVLGDKWKSSFQFELRGTLKDGKDIFEIKDGKNGTILIRGNNGIAMASGFNYYLKNYVNVDYNPMYESNVNVAEIVPVGGTVVKEAQVDLRYALNFCTYSYTMAFWNWDEYEKFLDWCAMNSINLVLDIVGQEEVIRETLKEFNYTDEEIKNYLCGPAYFAWFYMQNLYSAGGPLPNAWFEQRVELGRKMHDRMQTYGISPVIQGFAGQVPETFADKNTGAVLTPKDGWSGYVRPSIIKTYLTTEEQTAGKVNYFADVAETFYEKQKNVFGDVSDYYATDPFHEGGNTGTLDIATIYEEVQKEMLKSNPNAMWVMQQWQGNLNATKMSKLDTSHTLPLDLQADMNPQHDLFEQNGAPWIYCMLHNFGGRMGLDGEVPVIASDPIRTLNETKNMKGIGMTPEAMENSPVVYELLFDTVWTKDAIDYEKWIDQYAKRRAGGTSESLQKAWDLLLETAYADKGIYYQGAAESVVNAVPGDTFNSASTWGHSNILYDKAKVDQALLLLKENYKEFSNSPAYKYDLADVAEQVLSNAAVEYHTLMVQAKNNKNVEQFEKLSTQFLGLIDLSDQILSTAKQFMLGTWIEAARKMITDADDWTKDLFEYNARSLVTSWGGERAATSGGLNDYSNRKWAGLTKDFYKARWEIWVRNRLAELKGQAKNAADAKAESNWFLWEYQWINRKSDDDNGAYAYSTAVSNADLSQLAQKAYDDFSYTNIGRNTGSETTAKVNVAKGKPVTTASTTQSGAIKNVTDGDTSTEWVASGKGPHEVTVDLQGTYQVDEIVLSVPQLAKQFPYTYKVELLSPDSEEWSTLAEYTEGAMGSNVTIAKSGIASKVKVTMSTSDTTDSPLTLTEITVYGEEAGVSYINLAAGKTPVTNKENTDPGYPLSNITDEVTTNLWKTTDWGPESYPADVTINLDKAESVDYLDIYFESAGRPFIFYVTVTDAAGKETTVFDKYKEHTGVTDSASYQIEVNKEIKAATVHMTGITGQGQFGASGPAMSEFMIMKKVDASQGADYGSTVTKRTGEIREALKKLSYDGYSGSYSEQEKIRLEDVLTQAENAAKAGLTLNKANEWIDKVNDAYQAFKENGSIYIDRDGLLAALSEADEVMTKLEELELSDVKAALKTAYDSAMGVYDTYRIKQAEIDAAKTALETALETAKKSLPEEPPVDPDQPDKPVDPDQPDKPVDPDQPDNPDTPTKPVDPPYTDVMKNEWYYNYVKDVFNKKLMTGLTSTTFGPGQTLVRAQFATILYRLEDQPKIGYSARFGDVPDSQFFTKPVLWAASKGVVTGYSNGYFGPNDDITREQMALMMYRYAKFKGYDTKEKSDLSRFQDSGQVSSYAKSAMEWCVAKGIISGQGTSVKMLNPQGKTSRAECATIISRYAKLYE